VADPIIIRIPRRAANVALAALVLVSVVAFTIWLDRGPGAVEARAERYLAALVNGDARTAWDQLTDRVRTISGSFDAFEAAVGGADWSRFEYEVPHSSHRNGRDPSGSTEVVGAINSALR